MRGRWDCERRWIWRSRGAAYRLIDGLNVSADAPNCKLLWMGGVPPILLAGFALILVPNDRRVVPYGYLVTSAREQTRKLPITELFLPQLRRTTLILAAMFGLNCFGSQAFVGWVTSCLRDARGLGDAAIGSMVAWQFTASIAGGFVWGWFAEFNWGRVIIFFAALITAAVAESIGLGTAMMLGAVAFCGAAVLWRILPETPQMTARHRRTS